MITKIIKYLIGHKKNFYHKFAVLALTLLIIGIFYGNFLLVKKLVADLINEEKNVHAQEVCATMNEINQEADFFTEQIGQLKNQRNYLDKDQKKTIIQKLRKLEGNVRKIDIAYTGFYNDLSLKFFSWKKGNPADGLFSQIKNLPIYGYRAVEAMENSLETDYITTNQKDVLQLEIDALKGKIRFIDEASKICAIFL